MKQTGKPRFRTVTLSDLLYEKPRIGSQSAPHAYRHLLPKGAKVYAFEHNAIHHTMTFHCQLQPAKQRLIRAYPQPRLHLRSKCHPRREVAAGDAVERLDGKDSA